MTAACQPPPPAPTAEGVLKYRQGGVGGDEGREGDGERDMWKGKRSGEGEGKGTRERQPVGAEAVAVLEGAWMRMWMSDEDVRRPCARMWIMRHALCIVHCEV